MSHVSMLRLLVSVLFFALIGWVYWKDQRVIEQPAGEARELYGFQLREASASAGLRFEHRGPELDPRLANIAPHIGGVGAGVAVSDIDNDGCCDIYVVTSRFGEPNALFSNNGDGTFTDIAAMAGVADLNSPELGASMGSVFADADNDGDEDLLVYKWGRPQLYRNDGGTFTDVTDSSGLSRFMNSNSAVFVDYDRDGLVDIYLAGYFRPEHVLWDLDTTRIMQESFEFAENGGDNVLFRNLGDLRFEDVTEQTRAGSTRWTFAVAAADFDGDGWQDLYLANDYGTEELLLNRPASGGPGAGAGNGARSFERPERVGLESDSKSGMSVAVGDFENQGRLAVYVTNITRPGFLFQGNNLRRNFLAEDGRFDEVAEGLVADCGWAWGAQFGDLNNDGWQDLFVVNGFVSADPAEDYWYAMSKVAGAVGDLFEDAAVWEPMSGRSLSGRERSRLLLNEQGLADEGGFAGSLFRDVAAQVGVEDRLDGRAVAMADLFNRGQLDVLVANQNQPLLLYRNDVVADRHWIQFRLRGNPAAGSNVSAIGARVTVWFGDAERTMVQTQVICAGSGFSAQNGRRLHFGLGQHDRVDRVEVAWPSGRTQTIDAPAVDQLHIVEEALKDAMEEPPR